MQLNRNSIGENNNSEIKENIETGIAKHVFRGALKDGQLYNQQMATINVR